MRGRTLLICLPAIMMAASNADKPSPLNYRSPVVPARPPAVRAQARRPVGHEPPVSERTETGIASYFGAEPLPGAAKTKLTAAHPKYPFGSHVRVTNLATGRSAMVTITDRGPYTAGRIISVDRETAQELGFVNAGTAHVRVEYVDGPDSRNGTAAR